MVLWLLFSLLRLSIFLILECDTMLLYIHHIIIIVLELKFNLLQSLRGCWTRSFCKGTAYWADVLYIYAKDFYDLNNNLAIVDPNLEGYKNYKYTDHRHGTSNLYTMHRTAKIINEVFKHTTLWLKITNNATYKNSLRLDNFKFLSLLDFTITSKDMTKGI